MLLPPPPPLPPLCETKKQDELYFLQSTQDLVHPLNHRNEAAAVSLVVQKIIDNDDNHNNNNDDNDSNNHKNNITSLTSTLSAHCESLWPLFRHDTTARHSHTPTHSARIDTSPTATSFHEWSQKAGIQSSIQLAFFDPTAHLRGGAATQDIPPGHPILSIPRTALIYDETVRETDLGRMLAVLPGLSTDNLLIVFTLCDRFDPDSQWAPFWQSLPDAFYTGLSFPPHLVSALRGTAAHLEILRGQVHLRKQYQATRPLLDILLQAYPQYLQEDWFTYERYLWAAELFYSYAFEIEFPPATMSKTVMVPFACHVNHSPWPHVVRYGRLHAGTQTLDFPAFRPVKQGEQVFISYGPVPNMKLLTYYGFSIADNPHDLVPLTLEMPAVEDTPENRSILASRTKAMEKYGIRMEHSLRNGPLAAQLMGCLRLVVAEESELEVALDGTKNPLLEPLSDACEVQALQTLHVALQGLLNPVEEALKRWQENEQEGGGGRDEIGDDAGKRNENGFDLEWKTSLEFCRVYVEGQKKIIKQNILDCRRRVSGHQINTDIMN